MENLTKVNPYNEKFPAVKLRPEDQDAFVWTNGVRVIHEKATKCPHYYNKESNHGDITCNACENGYITYDPREIFMTFIQKNADELFMVQGLWESGDALVSFPSKYENGEIARFNYFDRITFLDFTQIVSDLYKKSETDIDQIRYDVEDVVHIQTVSEVYHKNTDFIAFEGNIKWISAHRPNAGEIYTMAYLYKPIYRIINFLHEGRFYYRTDRRPYRTPTYLPVQAHVRRDYIWDKKKNYD